MGFLDNLIYSLLGSKPRPEIANRPDKPKKPEPKPAPKASAAKSAPAKSAAPKLVPGAASKDRPAIQGVNIFEQDPWLKDVARKALDELVIPWECSPELIQAAKDEAYQMTVGGFVKGPMLDRLKKEGVFKTKADASHAMIDVTYTSGQAVTIARMGKSGAKKFEWQYMGGVVSHLCTIKAHKKYAGKKFPIDKGAGPDGDYPGKLYGCRCVAYAVFSDDKDFD